MQSREFCFRVAKASLITRREGLETGFRVFRSVRRDKQSMTPVVVGEYESINLSLSREPSTYDVYLLHFHPDDRAVAVSLKDLYQLDGRHVPCETRPIVAVGMISPHSHHGQLLQFQRTSSALMRAVGYEDLSPALNGVAEEIVDACRAMDEDLDSSRRRQALTKGEYSQAMSRPPFVHARTIHFSVDPKTHATQIHNTEEMREFQYCLDPPRSNSHYFHEYEQLSPREQLLEIEEWWDFSESDQPRSRGLD